MKLQGIISRLTPINTKEKVDVLIQLMKENKIKLNQSADIEINIAIRKVAIQLYYAEKYGRKVIKRKNKGSKKENNSEVSNLLKELKANKEKSKPTQKVKKTKVKAKRKAKRFKYGTVERLLENFGSVKSYVNASKKSGKNTETNQITNKNEKKEYPTYTSKSIHPIYIPSGGLNKR